MKFDPVKGIVTALLGAYYLWYAFGDPLHNFANWNIVDDVDLIIHEAGHFVFMFFGNFIHVLGGSLMQILIPIIFAGYFFWYRREYFSGSVILFWVAQNIINVSVYMGDSVVQQLPLLGGDGVIHDWNYLLSHTGLLGFTDVLSRATYGVGVMLVIAAIVLCAKFSFKESKQAPIS